MIRQRNISPGSGIGEDILEVALSGISADTADSVYIPDCDEVEITEIGGMLWTLTGTTPAVDLQVLYLNDAGDVDDPATGTKVYDTADDTNYRLDAADEARAYRPNPDGKPIRIICPVQTLANVNKRGVMIKIAAIEVATVTDATGRIWVRFRAFRSGDL